MTTLVTGGAGYIGSHMVLELLARREKVVVLDDLSSGFAWAVPHGVPAVIGDVGDRVLVGGLLHDHKVTSIVHFAGSIQVAESVSHPTQYYRNNTVNSLALIEAAIEHGVGSFLFSSTAAVYGAAGEGAVTENAPMAPTSPYGASKLMTETMLRHAAEAHGLPFAALRYFNVAGADPQGRAGQTGRTFTHLIKIACQAAVGLRESLDIYGTDYATADGTCVRDYIHVSDLVNAHALVLDYLKDGGAPFIANCGYGTGLSVLEIIEAVKTVAKCSFNTRIAPRRAGDPPRIVADSTLLRSTINWKPQFDNVHTIIAHALNWERGLQQQEFLQSA